MTRLHHLTLYVYLDLDLSRMYTQSRHVSDGFENHISSGQLIFNDHDPHNTKFQDPSSL